MSWALGKKIAQAAEILMHCSAARRPRNCQHIRRDYSRLPKPLPQDSLKWGMVYDSQQMVQGIGIQACTRL